MIESQNGVKRQQQTWHLPWEHNTLLPLLKRIHLQCGTDMTGCSSDPPGHLPTSRDVCTPLHWSPGHHWIAGFTPRPELPAQSDRTRRCQDSELALRRISFARLYLKVYRKPDDSLVESSNTAGRLLLHMEASGHWCNLYSCRSHKATRPGKLRSIHLNDITTTCKSLTYRPLPSAYSHSFALSQVRPHNLTIAV